MKPTNLLILIAFFIASLASDLAGNFMATAGSNYSLPYNVREALKQLSNVPWSAIVFGVLFGSVAHLTGRHHTTVSKEEVVVFTLVTTLIFVILMYGGALAAPVLASFHVDMMLFGNVMAGLFVSLVVWKGLHIRLGGVGVFLTTLLSLFSALSVMFNWPLPVNPQQYWFTIIGTFMGLFAAFDHA